MRSACLKVYFLFALFNILSLSLFSLAESGSDDFDDSSADNDYDYGAGADTSYGNVSSDGYDGEQSAGAKLLSSSEAVKEFLKDDDESPVVLGFFDLSTNIKDKAIFDKIAEKNNDDYRFASIVSKEILEEYKFDGCAVLVYPPSKFISEKDEKAKARYPSKILKAETLTKFISEKSLPLVGHKTYVSEQRYRNSDTPELTLFADVNLDKNLKGFQYFANRLRKVAKDFKGKIVFNIADRITYKHSLEDDYDLEVSEDNKKEVLIGLQSKNTFYKSTKPFSVDNVRDFINDFLAGKLVGKEGHDHEAHSHEDKPYEDEDTSDDESAVVELTESTFEAAVMKSTVDVLVEFYAPWCGHCRSLKPKYNKLAKAYENDRGVTITAFDATAGEFPKDFKVEGYPTLYWVPADTKKPVSYEGPREYRDIDSFIKKHRTTSK